MKFSLLFILFLLSSVQSAAHEEIFIVESKILGKSIEVRLLETAHGHIDKPVVYITDGKKMYDNGFWKKITELTEAGKIPAAYYVFVSTIAPLSGEDLRNDYFFCNADYLAFFAKELLPAAENRMPKKFQAKERCLVGISFGGLNAAYFSAHTDLFGGYGLLSPVTYPCEKVVQDLVFSSAKNLRIYLSTGRNDAENYLRPLERIYKNKGHKVKTVQTEGGHDFANWNEQVTALLGFLLN